MTTYADAYDMGWEAFLCGAYRNDNPFEVGTEQREAWITGWTDCKNEEI